jgi:hypothetical protein
MVHPTPCPVRHILDNLPVVKDSQAPPATCQHQRVCLPQQNGVTTGRLRAEARSQGDLEKWEGGLRTVMPGIEPRPSPTTSRDDTQPEEDTKVLN